ncbi:MAG: amidohydrolase family protein, partial [Lentisphaeria bacterium]|nr:amidohydrolase family protein [Lentisphaeria bacterium]
IKTNVPVRVRIPEWCHGFGTNKDHTVKGSYACFEAGEFEVKLTLEHCTEGHWIAEPIAASGCPVAGGPTLSPVSKPELRNKSFETAGILDRAGCKVSIITDSGVIPQEHLALCAALAVKGGMDEFSALQAITINPAQHLGIADRVGSIEVGKDADMIVCSGNILDTATQVEMVYIDGVRRD